MACNNYSGTVKILVNKSSSVPQAKETYLRFKDVVSRHLKIDISPAGIILNDPNIKTSITRQQPALLLYPDSLACRCIRAMVSNLLKSDAGPHQEDDLNGFWQRYFDYTLQDLALPECPGIRKTPKRSFQLLSPANAGDGLNDAEEGRKLPKNRAEYTRPFVEGDGIFALADLPIPTPLLANYPAVYGRFSENFGHDAALLELERRIFTTNHAEIAAKALRTWQQAREYALLQSALPGTPVAKTLPETLRSLFYACDILFGIRPVLCLVPDRRLGVLKGIGYPGCFGWDTLVDVQFSLQWEKSLVVQAFLSGQLRIVPEEDRDALPLADQQLFRALDADGCVCVPMIKEGMNHGVIVFGLQKNQGAKIDSLRNQLEQFGAQAAGIFCKVPV